MHGLRDKEGFQPISDPVVAFARAIEQFGPILDRDCAPPVVKNPSIFEIRQEFVGRLPRHSQHVREMLLRQRQISGSGSILKRKEPPGTALLDGVMPIAGNQKL